LSNLTDTNPIVIVSPSKFPGTSGDTYNFLEIINQFLLEGLRVVLICPKTSKKDGVDFEKNNPNLEVIRINCIPPRLNEINKGIKVKDYLKFLLFLLMETITVWKTIRGKKVKKLFVRHSILTMQLPILFKLLKVTTLADGEFVSDTVKHIFPAIFFKLFLGYEKRIIKLYSYFKVSSTSQVENLENIGYPRNRILVIPISINTEKIPRFRFEQIPEHTFGYFGGLEPWQGIDALVKAFKLLVKKIPSAYLYIIGEGSLLEDLQKSVTLSGLQTNVFFLGKIKREDLWNEYFKKFRIVVIPRQRLNNSIDTIMPIKMIEAMAAGKPIIAMDIPVMREIKGNPILRVSSGDPQLLADAMYSLSTSYEELTNRCALSIRASSNYDVKNNIKTMISILKY
jgi:glycosyltransferase involved in cell wall biosynthesis